MRDLLWAGPQEKDLDYAYRRAKSLLEIYDQAEWLRGRGVVFEEYDFPGLRTVNDIAEVRDSEGNLFGKGAWFRDSEGNLLGIGQPMR